MPCSDLFHNLTLPRPMVARMCDKTFVFRPIVDRCGREVNASRPRMCVFVCALTKSQPSSTSSSLILALGFLYLTLIDIKGN